MLDILLKIVTIGSVLTGAVAVYIALRNNSRQVGAQIFLAYSKRIHEMRHSLGAVVDLYELAERSDGELEPESRRIIIDAIHLAFEFHSLQTRGYVAADIWSIWEIDIARIFSTPAVRTEWAAIERHFDIHPNFRAWVSAMSHRKLVRGGKIGADSPSLDVPSPRA